MTDWTYLAVSVSASVIGQCCVVPSQWQCKFGTIKIASIVVTCLHHCLNCSVSCRSVCLFDWGQGRALYTHMQSRAEKKTANRMKPELWWNSNKTQRVVQWYEHVYLCFRMQPVSHNQKIMFELMKIKSCSLSQFTLKLTWPQLLSLSLSVLPIESEGGDTF